MCGIAGVISPQVLGPEVQAAVRRMNQAMGHRGPDDEGYYFGDNVALVMRRLSIIDVAGGHQPLQDEQGNIVVCNGEIYNYVELKQELTARGHRFRTKSDVETILPLYSELGEKCPTKLRGMFAFALWDGANRTLLLARDRFGEKPLYLHRDTDGRLWFASEMKALLAGLDRDGLTLSPQSAHLFLVYQYVPEPLTMFEGVQKLPAGHYLRVSLDQLAVTGADLPQSRAYWHYLDAAPRSGDPFTEVRAALEDAARITLRSDVPVGVALSGGIDSGLVAVLARKFHAGELKAFSVGYPGRPENDERAAAEALAKRLDMAFHDVELSSDQFVSMFPFLVRDMDDPVGDIAAYGYHAVSRLARAHGVPVLLSGLGADELFWGYEWVREAVQKSIAKRQRRLPRWVARLMDPHPNRAVFYDSLDWMRDSAPLATKLMTPEAEARVPADLWASYFESSDWGDVPLWLMDIQNRTWLTSNCLALGDRVSMAHSVELRLPFLDHGLTDTVTGLRKAGLRDWDRSHKWLLIEAVRDLLPHEVLSRKKRGFTPPVSEWMNRVVRSYGATLRDGALVNSGMLVRDVADHLFLQRPVGFTYRLVLLELWTRLFVQRATPDDIAATVAIPAAA